MAYDQSRLDWVKWWAGLCVLQADPDWDAPRFFTPATPRLLGLIHLNPPALGRYFALPMHPPPEPNPLLMRLAALNGGQRAQVLRLMAAVCLPPDHRREQATEPEIWCRGVAKALRPGLWLPDAWRFSDDAEALALLRVYFGEPCWPRLRLLYPRGLAQRCPLPEHALPRGRLDALCDAVIWKAALRQETAITPEGEKDVNEKEFPDP